MGQREDIERTFLDWDEAGTPGGCVACKYSEAYEDVLDAQGVARSLMLARHVADERGLAVGAVVDWIRTRAGEWIAGPFTVETYEPLGRLVVRLRLRDSRN